MISFQLMFIDVNMNNISYSNNDFNSIDIGTNVKYAIYVHDGTDLPMAPNRFLKKAVENNIGEINDLIKQELT